MVLILTFILFLAIFLLVIDFFSVLFRLTGMPLKKARFQVISLLTSTGFTTKESEMIVRNPLRRKLASWLMVISYVSTATFISFFVRMLSDSVTSIGFFTVVIIFIIVVAFFHKTSLLEKFESKIELSVSKSKIWEKLNAKHFTLITDTKGYGIYEIYLAKDSSLIGKSIMESNLKDLEIEVLNIDKGDEFIKFPSPDYIFEIYDNITVYGNLKNIRSEFKYVSGQ
ncbi:cation:proton antiporter regulatory subunit [Clostridium sp.]|uniref:cation:proton antiporter regulatory subunit n=1 Tax=Clostridium sp. TaxID=1506 RepID=UPI0026DB86FB|nr:TrkA C-terminal domain-containing protein [Clostridium sp.]MDO5038994.1 TrkA C-terminal domain-containing protein [Clostridium sp.]